MAKGISKVYHKISIFAIIFSLGLFYLSLERFNRKDASVTMLLGQDLEPVLQLRKFDQGWLTYSASGLDDLLQKCADALLTNESVRISSQLQGDIGASRQAAAQAILAKNPGFPRAHAVGLIVAPGVLTAEAYDLATAAAPFEPSALSVRLLAARNG